MKSFKQFVIETLAIFIGLLASFSVERCNLKNETIQNTNDSILTLIQEINSNIDYCEEHLKQLKNMKKVNEELLKNFKTFSKSDLIKLHKKYPFGHSYNINGSLSYWNTEVNYENIYQWMITWWNTWAPENIYFQSLINSGNLVLIKNHIVRKEIESVYTTRKERVLVNLALLKENSDKIRGWAEEKRNNSASTISRESVYDQLKDNKLKNLLEDRDYHVGLRVMSVENYIKSLKNLRKLIDENYGE